MTKKKNSEAAEKEEKNNTSSANEESTNKSKDPVVNDTAEQNAEVPSADELLAAEHDKYLRVLAEYDNFRKRSQKEREALYTDVRADTVLKLLPVYDNLARALANETTDAAFYKGVEMTMSQFKEILSKMGVVEIEALGKEFDPTIHNAVMHVEDDSCGTNIIVEEFEKGFKLGDKVIRFSMVKVAN